MINAVQLKIVLCKQCAAQEAAVAVQTGHPVRCGLSTSLRAQRSNPSFPALRHGLRRCAHNDELIRLFLLATSFARVLHRLLSALEIGGRREDRVHAAPAVSRAIAHRERAHEHTGSAETLRPSLRSGFTAYSALSPVNGSFATVAREKHGLSRT